MRLTIQEAIKKLQTPGTHFSGSDWKYGWPHKFYIGSDKFYNEELFSATPENFATFAELSKKYFGITWEIRTKYGKRVLWYQCPETKSFYGFQLFGETK